MPGLSAHIQPVCFMHVRSPNRVLVTFFNHMLGILQTLLTNFPLRKQALLKHPVLAKQPLASKVLSFLHVSHRPLGHIAAGTGRGYR
jgi:hypothetical protein